MISEVTLSPEVIADDLRPALLRLARELRKETEQLGVTARQATLLWLVKRSPGLSLAELAARRASRRRLCRDTSTGSSVRACSSACVRRGTGGASA